MNKLGRVSSKGQVVIPAELRKKLKITRTMLIREEGGKTVMEPWVSMEEAFGSGGKEMIEAAIEISRDRRREVEFERRSHAFDPASSSSSRPVSHPRERYSTESLQVGHQAFYQRSTTLSCATRQQRKEASTWQKSSADRSGGHP